MPFYTTLIPLLGVLSVTAVKDAFDDIVSLFINYPMTISNFNGTKPAYIETPYQ